MFSFTDTKAISEAGAWVHLKDGSKLAYLDEAKELPVRIKVFGPDSPTLQARLRKRAAQKLKEQGGSVNLSKMSASEIEAFLESAANSTAADWADRTITWENMPGGLEFSWEKAEALYDEYPAIVRQMEGEAGPIDHFLELAAKS